MEENISQEQKNSLIEQKRRKLQEMGLPIPMPVQVPGTVVNVRDPKMLQRIQQIKQGQLKKEINLGIFDQKSNQVEEMPVPKPKINPRQPQQQNKPEAPKLLEFTSKKDSSLDAVEQLFGGAVSPHGYSMTELPEDAGKGFVDDFRNKLRNRVQDKQLHVEHQPQVQYTQPPMQQIQSGMMVLNEADLKRKIIEISRQVAKQVATEVIREVLNEYAKKSSKPIVTEVKKSEAEILPNGKVRINGKLYNITPDTKKQ